MDLRIELWTLVVQTSMTGIRPEYVPRVSVKDKVRERNVCAAEVCVLKSLGHVRLFVTLWTVAHQAPLSMGFSR